MQQRTCQPGRPRPTSGGSGSALGYLQLCQESCLTLLGRPQLGLQLGAPGGKRDQLSRAGEGGGEDERGKEAVSGWPRGG